MNVEIRQLRVLVAVAEARSFTQAATALRMSQVGVSRSIARLEHEVGSQLVHRTTRRMSLTDAGEELTRSARRILAELDGAIAGLRGDAAVIRLGYAWAAFGEHTTPLLREWNRSFPAEPLRMVRVNRRDAGLLDGLADVAITRHPVEEDGLASAIVGHEKRMAVLPADHRLADRSHLMLSELSDEVVAVDRSTGTTSPDLWREHSLPAPRIMSVGDVEEWLDLVAAGDAIGVTASATAHHYPRPGVVFVSVVDAPPIEVRVAWSTAFRHPSTDRIVRRIARAYRTAASPKLDARG